MVVFGKCEDRNIWKPDGNDIAEGFIYKGRGKMSIAFFHATMANYGYFSFIGANFGQGSPLNFGVVIATDKLR